MAIPEVVKVYYSIGEVAELLQVNDSTIRFWEGEFEEIKPRKNRKGNRQFTVQDIENIKLIQHLLKDKGYTIEGAKKILKSKRKNVVNQLEAIEKLKEIRIFLENLLELFPIAETQETNDAKDLKS
ncbi:MAG: MerR family transcriptional regulator [Chitinophagales bacterium]|nr:MerR family transcriptional regulator [Bacteroidota bacterium]MCB9043186.1 MerR family transcriptional regulator [Chitinophagales bacterium]